MSSTNAVPFAPPKSRIEADLVAAARQDRAEDQADQRLVERATKARSEAEDKERHDKIEAAVNPAVLMAAEPPSAEDLHVDITGLPPQRGRLVRYRAWLEALEQQQALYEQGRANYLVSIGLVPVTEAEIANLKQSDQTIFGHWLRSGGEQNAKPLLRGQQREDLERTLADRKHERDTAVAALDGVEFDADCIARKLEILRTRGEAFLSSALIEHADATCAVYEAQIEAMQQTLCSLYALATVARQPDPFDGGAVNRDRRFYRGNDPAAGHSVRMPTFGALREQEIVCDRDDIRQAAKPWEALAATWRNDPMADPPAEA